MTARKVWRALVQGTQEIEIMLEKTEKTLKKLKSFTASCGIVLT
jgi:hypothetical protein